MTGGLILNALRYSSSGGGANLGSVTFTENDTFTPTAPLDGWDEVTVQVPTYEDEYRDALERIAELEEQVEECDQCKADVIAKLQEYDPNFDPQTCEDIPSEIGKVVDDEKEKASGYTFPDGTPYDPTILDAVGGDPITDVQTGQTIHCELTEDEYMHGVTAWYTDANGNYYHINGIYSYNPDTYYTNYKCTMQDPTTGTVHITWTQKSHADPSYSYTFDFTQVVPELTGYGASGHTYKVHNT